MEKNDITHVHMKVPPALNSRIKRLAAAEEVRTGKRVLIRDKYLQILEAGVDAQEAQERK